MLKIQNLFNLEFIETTKIPIHASFYKMFNNKLPYTQLQATMTIIRLVLAYKYSTLYKCF